MGRISSEEIQERLAALVKQLAGPSKGAQEKAARDLATLAQNAEYRWRILGVPGSLPALARLLESKSKGVQEQATGALASLAVEARIGRAVANLPGMLTTLSVLLDSRSKAVQSAAARALGNLAADENIRKRIGGVRGTLTSVAQLLWSSDGDVQKQATWAVVSLARDAGNRSHIAAVAGTLTALVNLLRGKNEGVQEAAAEALWILAEDASSERSIAGMPGLLAALVGLLGSSETGVQEKAALALGILAEAREVGSPGAVTAVPNTPVKLGKLLRNVMGEESFEWAVQNLPRDTDASKKVGAFPGALGALAKLLESPSRDVQGSATWALANLAESQVVESDVQFHNIAARLRQLEAGMGRDGAPELTELTEDESKCLRRLLDRESNAKGLEEELAAIANDPCALQYYRGVSQALSWLFIGAQARLSKLVKGERERVNQGLISTASVVAGLVPVFGNLASMLASKAAGIVADFFEKRKAERIATAGGLNGDRVAEGVARCLVLLRKGELSGLSTDGVKEVVTRDVESMMEWVKDQDDLQVIRDDKDLTGEGVIRNLVAAAERTSAALLGNAARVITPHLQPPSTASVHRATVTASIVTSTAAASGSVTAEELSSVEQELREEFNTRLHSLNEERELERRQYMQHIESLEAQVTAVITALHSGYAPAIFDDGHGQLYVQVRAQQGAPADSWEDQAHGSCYNRDDQIQRLSSGLSSVQGQLDHVERNSAGRFRPRSDKKGFRGFLADLSARFFSLCVLNRGS